jgi:hypothetical protein
VFRAEKQKSELSALLFVSFVTVTMSWKELPTMDGGPESDGEWAAKAVEMFLQVLAER